MSDPQRILQIVNELSNTQQSNPGSPSDLVKTYLSEFMNFTDFDELQEEEKFEKSCEAFESLFDCMQILANEYKKKASSSSKALPGSQSQGKNHQSFDPNSTIRFLQCIVKVQAWWKKEFTLRKLQREAERDRMSMSSRKEEKNPDEAALREFTSQLSNKKITPEGFFRICDSDYKQAVRVDVFKDCIAKFGIQLSRGQLSRLTMILDEDIEGTITREEYYNALEAYNVSGEKHKSLDGFSVYYQFEYRTLFKLIVELRMKDISFVQMFNACDVNDDQRIEIAEVRKFVEGFNPEFKQKEVHALMNYIDIDKNGKIDRDEFIRQLTRGEQTYKQSLQLQKQNYANSNSGDNQRPMSAQPTRGNVSVQKAQQNNFFEEDEVDRGDQAGFFDYFTGGSKKEVQPMVDNKVALASKGKQQPAQVKPQGKQMQQHQVQQPDAKNVQSFMSKIETEKEQFKKQVIGKMESSGQSVKGFFTSLKGKMSGGAVPLGTVLQHLELSHPNVSLKEKYELIKDCISGQHVDYAKLEETFSKHSQTMQPSCAQTFSVITGNIVKRMGGNPNESIRQFFKAQGIDATDQMSEMEFMSLFSGRFSTLTKQELALAFKSINIDMDGFILISDLIEVLISYTQGAPQLSLSTKDLTKIIPGIEAMSPRSRIEELIEYIIAELKTKNMVPLNAFKMAITKDQNQVQTLALEQAFKKILPNVQSEVFSEAMNAFKLNGPRDYISRSDFEAVFNSDQKTYIPHSQSINRKTDSAKKPTGKVDPPTQAKQDESTILIRKLDDAMLRQGLSPAVAFRGADLNHNNVVTVDELRESIKKFLPDNVLSLADLKKIMMAFDLNRNGMIEEEEFITLFERARNANVTIIESPMKQSRILSQEQLDGDSRKSRLPLKGNQGQSNQQVIEKVDQSSIVKTVQLVESKINLKKFFGELNFGKEGEIVINDMARKFKTEKSNAGQGLMPEQYMGIIRYLDQGQKGFVIGKDLLKFCDQFLKLTHKTDVQLELKHIANIIEVQRRSKNTKQFFETNSLIKGNVRIKEVEVLSEFQKLFGISSAYGPVLFKHFDANKTGKELTLDDICKQIDVHRLVPIDPILAKTESSKLNPEGVVTKFVIRLMGSPQVKQNKLTQKIEEVVKAQKGIFYEVIFNVFVTEYALLNNAESKAFFEYLKATSSIKNGIDINTYNQAINENKLKIKQAQEDAFEAIISQYQQFPLAMSKVRMNDLGFMNKNSIKEHFAVLNIIPQQGAKPDNTYTLKLCQLLNIEKEFVFPPSFTAAKHLNLELSEQLENCEFWVVLDVLSRLSGSKDPLEELIFKFLGTLFDNVAPTKPSFSVLQLLQKGASSISINNATAFQQLIIQLYLFAQKNIKGQGFQHGEISQSCQHQLQLLWQKLGNKPMQITNDSSVLLQRINRHRAKLPVSSQSQNKNEFQQEEDDFEGDQLQPEIQNQEIIQNVDINLVKQIEKSLKTPIEDAVENIISQEQIAKQQFQKIFLQISQTIDKNLISQLALQIDFKNTGIIQIKNLISYLKQVPGKYQKDYIVKSLKDIEEPLLETLEQQEIIGSDEYSLEDFCEKIQNIINVPNKFNAACLFYDVCGYSGDGLLQGSKLIQYIEDLKKGKPKAQPQKQPVKSKQEQPIKAKIVDNQDSASKSSMGKKVQFAEFDDNQEDSHALQQQSIAIAKQFIQAFQKPKSQELVQNALVKFSKEIQNLKTQADFVKKYSVNGQDKQEVSLMHQKVNEMKSLTNDEKLVISFIAIDIQKIDTLIVDLANFYKTMALYKKTPTQANEKKPEEQKVVQAKSNNSSLAASVVSKKNAFGKSIGDEHTEERKIGMKDVLPKLIAGLAKPANSNKLTKIFAASNGYISQYDLFEFINKDLGITGPEDQLDVLSYEFDEFGQAELAADNFMEFCEEFEIPFNLDFAKINFEKKEDVRTKIRQDKKGEQLSILDMQTQEEIVSYKLTEDDFFRGIPTILNSEIAALVQAERMYNEVDHYKTYEEDDDEDDGEEPEKLFYDKDFGPKFKGDLDGSRFALYCDGKPPKPSFIDPANILWLRPHSYIKGDKKPQFIDDEASSNEVKQGGLGDCWLIGALSVLASRDELIMGDLKSIQVKANYKIKSEDCEKLSIGVYPPIFHIYRKKGLYVLRFFKNFQWRYVIVDDRLPCNKSSYKPYYATCTNLHELWVPLIEKAYAKLHGCYQSLISGYIDDAIDEMTGLVSDKIKLHNQQQLFPHKSIKSADEFWNFLVARKAEKCMMGCSSSGETEGQIKHDGKPSGILAGHAYGLLDVIEIDNPELERARKTHRLLRVRNPWGQTEWQGNWSDNSDQMEAHQDKIVEKIKELYKDSPEEEFIPGQNDGTFMINFSNWRDIYNNMFIIYDFPNSYVAVRCESEWSKAKQNTGGTPASMDEKQIVNWAKNPQFLFAPKKDCNLFVSLAQPDGRAQQKDKNGKPIYYTYPYVEVINPICLMIYELEAGKTKVERFKKERIPHVSIIRESREVALNVELKAGKSYVIVPSCKSETEEGIFYLSLYFSIQIRDVQIKCLNDPSVKFSDIAEETENYDVQPKWKKKLIQNRLRFMMSGEDNDVSLNESMMNASGPVSLADAMKKATQKESDKMHDSPSDLNNSQLHSNNTSFVLKTKANVISKETHNYEDFE